MNKGTLIVFIVAFIYLAIVQFSCQTIVEPTDTFYHMKMAEIIRHHGPVKNFPWIQFCAIGKDRFVDFDFLFHLLLIPFTFLGLVSGAKLAAVVFSAFIITILYYIIDKKNLPFPFFWALSIFAAGNVFMIRLTFTRGYLVAIILSLLAAHLIVSKKHKALFFLSLIYALAYTSAMLVLLYALVFFCVYRLKKEEFSSKILSFAFAGWVVGSIIHPNFPNNIRLLWVKSFSVIILHWSGVNLSAGRELLPLSTRELITDLGYIVFLLMIALYMVIINNKKISSSSLSLLIITTILFAGTFMSRRTVEYAIPFSLYTCAFLSGDLLGGVRTEQYRNLFKRRQWRAGIALITALFIIFSVSTFKKEWEALAGKVCFSIRNGAVWLNNNSKEGDMVFNCGWDDFPQLFFFNPKGRYIVGMDPTYFYMYNRTLWKKWTQVYMGKTENIYDIIKNDFHADWVFCTTNRRYHNFINRAAKESRLERVYSDKVSVVYKVK